MFRNAAIAEFIVNDHRISLIIDAQTPISSVQEVLNQVMHFCVEKINQAKADEEQKRLDEEAVKPCAIESDKTVPIDAQPVEG